MPDETSSAPALTATQITFLRKFLAAPAAKPPPAISLVKLQKARLLYSKTLDHVRTQLKALEAAIVRTFKDTPQAKFMAANAKTIYRALNGVDLRLIECLDKALNADNFEQRAKLQAQAVALVDEYTRMINANPVIGILDDNPIHPVTVRKALESSLGVLKAQLS